MTNIHATSVLIDDNHAVLIRGASGSGKSNLALKLIDNGAILISDDQTIIENSEGSIWAKTAPNIAGLLEVRGIGIVEVDHAPQGILVLIIDLQSPVAERIPDPAFELIADTKIRRAVIDPNDPMALKKINIALKLALND
tara:strand:+ start:13 stop:432 length:420 start_codon:yes stop_codon:yes gene_type:complete